MPPSKHAAAAAKTASAAKVHGSVKKAKLKGNTADQHQDHDVADCTPELEVSCSDSG